MFSYADVCQVARDAGAKVLVEERSPDLPVWGPHAKLRELGDQEIPPLVYVWVTWGRRDGCPSRSSTTPTVLGWGWWLDGPRPRRAQDLTPGGSRGPVGDTPSKETTSPSPSPALKVLLFPVRESLLQLPEQFDTRSALPLVDVVRFMEESNRAASGELCHPVEVYEASLFLFLVAMPPKDTSLVDCWTKYLASMGVDADSISEARSLVVTLLDHQDKIEFKRPPALEALSLEASFAMTLG